MWSLKELVKMQDIAKLRWKFSITYTIGGRVFVKYFVHLLLEVVINSNHVVQHLALHTVGMYCPLWTTLCFFSISNNDYNTVGKLITIINVNDSATMCCRNRVSLYVRVCKQNSWRNMTDFDKFHRMDCLQKIIIDMDWSVSVIHQARMSFLLAEVCTLQLVPF